MFGIGGGMVKGPLMLEMGVSPAVVSATVATMILYTSAAATVAFAALDMLPYDYAAFFFVYNLICTGLGAK
jgi:uncharacterized membrane protein YfcA